MVFMKSRCYSGWLLLGANTILPSLTFVLHRLLPSPIHFLSLGFMEKGYLECFQPENWVVFKFFMQILELFVLKKGLQCQGLLSLCVCFSSQLWAGPRLWRNPTNEKKNKSWNCSSLPSSSAYPQISHQVVLALAVGTEASKAEEEADSWGSLTYSKASLPDVLWAQSIGRVLKLRPT